MLFYREKICPDVRLLLSFHLLINQEAVKIITICHIPYVYTTHNLEHFPASELPDLTLTSGESGLLCEYALSARGQKY